ncbi:serine/threonine-protein kinase [Thalassomonas haliotis]|uniref:Protein kinase n=1 Tax=Thalassomonas haliotis TaxID=485448 RepID=A0ABY7VJM2_9GAMM|nr:serine/threonine-protein kinase [Thalassomonas haliotis]WDE13680.1 protein kinase [Thalassomonas haliotis]
MSNEESDKESNKDANEKPDDKMHQTPRSATEQKPTIITNSGDYQVQQKIGQGGMGQVYLALDTRLQRTVAIKVLTPLGQCLSSDDTAVESSGDKASHFQQALAEARLLAKLNHPNIVQIYDVIVSSTHTDEAAKPGKDDQQQIALVMEYLGGKTLQQFQHQHVTTLIQKLQIIRQIALGLAAAHDNGIVHCDLKASNILIDIDNKPGSGNQSYHPHGQMADQISTRVKIIDFGIARVNNNGSEQLNEQATSSSSNTSGNSSAYGSWTSMSPEQLSANASEETIDFRTDLFSLGIIAFNLIAGRHPFATSYGTDSAQQIAQAIIDDKPGDAKDIIPQLPLPLAHLLNQLLAHQPQNRPTSSHKVAERLQQIIVALTQQEILAEQTLPVGEDGTVLQPDKTKIQTSATNEENAQQEKKPNKFAVMAAACIILLVTLSSLFYQNIYTPTAPKVRHIAVLPPTLSADSKIADIQKDLVVATIDDAIRQSIINTKHLRLISRTEVSAVSDNSAEININTVGNATGATDIITTELHCNNVRCNVILSRLSAMEDNNGNLTENINKKWTVVAQKNWPTQVDDFYEIHNTSQANINLLYPNYAETYITSSPINEQDYLEYIELYSKVRIYGENNDENLKKLRAVLRRSPYLYAGYSLFRETALNLFNETKDPTYPKQLEQLIQTAPPEYKYSVFQAIDTFGLTIATDQFDLAFQQLNVAQQRGVDSSTLTELKAYLSFYKNELPQAVRHYQIALELRPSTKLYYNLALSYYLSGDMNNAKTTLKQLLKINPAKYNANQLLADIYLMEGKLDLAINAYEQVVKVNPQSNDLDNLGIAYSLTGRYQDALVSAQLAVEKSPNHPSKILNLADAEMILGLKKQANLHYQQVIDLHLNEDDLLAQLNKAQALVHLNDNNSAIKALNKAKKLAPDNGNVAFSAALVYSLAGEKLSALSQVEEALASDIGVVWFNLPWFDNLCSSEQFKQLLSKAGNPKRCQP